MEQSRAHSAAEATMTLATLTSLVEAATAVVGQPDLHAVLRTLIATACTTTGARYAAVGVIGEHSTLSNFLYLGITEEEARLIGHPPVGKGVLGTLIRDPHPIRLDRIADHPDSSGFPDHHPPMETFLGVPIRSGETVFGNLYLTEKPGGFTPEDEAIVEALAAIAGSAVSTARLNDRLTRLALVEDRERIARDLHDAVIQDLFAVGITLQGLSGGIEEESVRHRMDEAIDRIDQAIGSLRTFIFDLRSLTGGDPARAIRRMAERLAAPHGIDVVVDADGLGPVSAERLDDTLLIVREAVSNAVRHARPSTVTITAARDGGELAVSIVDDGAGFDTTARSPGMGLSNMVARAARTGGRAEIDSHPGVGTRVSVRLPL